LNDYLLNIAIAISCLKRKFAIFIFSFFLYNAAFTQKTQFSLSTDVSLLRSVKKDQRYWAFGQTVTGHIHFTPRDGAYVWVCYYTAGKFANDLTANAKAPATIPQQIEFQNSARMRFRHMSIGWKRYLKGTFDIENKLSFYAYAGFGLMIGRVENKQSAAIDSSLYHVPVQSGTGNFKRLTFDLGLGTEFPIAPMIYGYLETRALLPTTDYPSPYLLINENAPLTIAINLGVRVIFE